MTATRLDPDVFLAFFEYLKTGSHYETKREPKKIYPELKPEMKAKFVQKISFSET